MDFSDLGGTPVTKKPAGKGIDFSDLGAKPLAAEGLPETGLQKLAGRITNVMQTIDNPGRLIGNEPPESTLMAAQGDSLFNRAGEAVTDYLGRKMPASPIIPALAGTAVSMANPQNWVTPEMPGTTPLPGRAALQESAQEAGRKSLGYTKAYLNKKPGNIDKANKVAQVMLDEGVITNPITHPFSSGTKSMMDRAEMINAASGQSMGENISTLSSSGKRSFSGKDVNREIESQLAPKFSGGAYEAENKIVQEIMDTVRAHGEGPLDFSSAQALKEKLQELGKFNSMTDQVKAKLYRRASGIVRDALDRSVAATAQGGELPVIAPGAKAGEPHALYSYNDQFGPGGTERSIYTMFGDPSHPVFQKKASSKAGGYGSSVTKADLDELGVPITGREPRSANYKPLDAVGKPDPALTGLALDYYKNKELFGATEQATKALTNRLSSEQGNKTFGLTDTVLAVGELAAGHPGTALASVGIKKAFERGYHAFKATTADALAKETLNPLQKRSMYTGVAVGNSSADNARRRALLSELVDRIITGKQ